MEKEITANELYSLCKSEMEYRNKLLKKYTEILTRSEDRVDNINKMIGNLLIIQQKCSERLDKEQESVQELIHLLSEKDKRIEYLEHELKDSNDRYLRLVDRYILNNSKCNENNFNLAK